MTISVTVIVISMFYATGFLCAVLALWRSRTTQGAAAWVIALILFPFVSLPLFLVFGRNRFYGYVKERKEYDRTARKELKEIENIFSNQTLPPKGFESINNIARLLVQPGFTAKNKIKLLVNGEATFESMFEEIEHAQRYILVQFYIFRSDEVGKKFLDLLVQRARAGIKVYILCDKVGTKFRRAQLKQMKDAGIEFNYFFSTKSWMSPFQVNFRNHRKNLVIDGATAFIGGLNVGDDYLGKWKSMGFWRDSHLKITGPGAMSAQLSFVKDWYWTHDRFADLKWETFHCQEGSDCAVLHTGPADDIEACALAHIELVSSACKRVWITTPYFVPPEAMLDALMLASLRGVDVRILTPGISDNRWVQLASKVAVERLIRLGVRFFRYEKGFLHQKVMLIDDEFSVVGSANLDSRSFFLNFEITAIAKDRELAKQIETMLENDFNESRELNLEDFTQRSLPKQILSRAVNLMSPML